jgi:hypothetical protein
LSVSIPFLCPTTTTTSCPAQCLPSPPNPSLKKKAESEYSFPTLLHKVATDFFQIASQIHRYPELYLQVANPTVREQAMSNNCRGIAHNPNAARVAAHIHGGVTTGALGYIVLVIPKNLTAAPSIAGAPVTETRPANASSRTTGRERSASSTTGIRHAEPCSHRPSLATQPRSSSTSSRKVAFAPDDAKPSSLSAAHANQSKLVPSSRSHSTHPAAAVFGAMQLQMRYVKETEGRRMKSERLRQKNALLFAERSMRWMAISQAVTLAFVAVVAIAVLKG